MELSFSSKELREICENHEAAVRLFGQEAALALKERLADIVAARQASQFMSLFQCWITQASPEENLIQISSVYKIRIRSGHPKTPITSTGETDWEKVTRIRIVNIEVAQ